LVKRQPRKRDEKHVLGMLEDYKQEKRFYEILYKEYRSILFPDKFNNNDEVC
jgi:hypothetical protein